MAADRDPDTPAPVDLSAYGEEVKAGLPNERADLDRALENQAFFDLDAGRYAIQRDAENTMDWQGRRAEHGRETGITREAIEALTEHLYCPGPSRRWDDGPGDEFLQRVYADNLIDAVMQRADQLAHLNDVAAIQVDAGAGDFGERPITLNLWGRDEFVAWTDANDARKVVALCTIEKVDLTTRYKLWSSAEVRTYQTSRATEMKGGRVAEFVGSEPNTYGRIPFEFVHYDLPVRRFGTPGIGGFLARAELHANDRLTRLDEAIHKHLNPIPWARGVPFDWNPIVEPGRFLKLKAPPRVNGMTGGYEPGEAFELGYLQVKIDSEGAWADLIHHLNQVFEACRVPLSAVRMEQSGTASGIAIVAEQAPLLSRARRRRGPAGYFEQCLARCILACAGSHYGQAALSASARSGRLTLGWSEPTIPIPGPDRDECDLNALKLGVTSRLRLIEQRYGCSRDQAIEILKGIAEDRKLEDSIDPEPVPSSATGDGTQPGAAEPASGGGAAGSVGDEASSDE